MAVVRERSPFMKWHCTLFVLIVAASTALAQELPPGAPNGTAAALASPTVASITDCGPVLDSHVPDGASDTFLAGNHNFAHFIGFISNPLQNIDPRAVTAIYPIFGSVWTSSSGPVPSGDFQLYGPALTFALSERFAFGLNQGGYADVAFSKRDLDRLSRLDPLGRFRDAEVGGSRTGWLNLGGFFQYTVIEDVPAQFLLTGGLRWEAPCGSHEIFQGHGPAHLAPYLTAGKELGNFHVLATAGYEFPAGPGSDNSQLFYADVHFDVQLAHWFYPVVEVNSIYHTNSVSFGLPSRFGFIDFGNSESSGNIVTLAVGANAVLVPERLELGAVYTTPLATQHDFDFNGLLVKMVLRY
jgi:hypothetical protein